MNDTEQPNLLKRRRLQASLQATHDKPLVVAIAAIGYGKTTAVQEFLKDDRNRETVYLRMTRASSDGRHAWKEVVKQIGSQFPVLGSKLAQCEYPETVLQAEACAELITASLQGKEVLLVLDDYHNVQFDAFNHLIEHLVQYPNTTLHILLLSRENVSLPLDELMLKGYCSTIYPETFQFSVEEILGFASILNIILTKEQGKTLWNLSKGWIAAIKLILQQYQGNGRLEVNDALYRLIEQSEVSKYSPSQFWLLKLLSHVDGYNASLASQICGYPITDYMTEQFEYESSFISHDQHTNFYHMHPILRAYLRHAYQKDLHAIQYKLGESDHPILSLAEIYRRAGSWYLGKQLPVEGFSYLLEAKDFDTIMEEFGKTSRNRLLDARPEFIVSLFNAIPREIQKRHFYAWLAYIGFYTTNIDQSASKTLLADIRAALHEEEKRLDAKFIQAVEGEITLIEAYAVFNDANRMDQCLRTAHTLLGGKSKIADMDKIISFGSPHGLYLYYRDKGKLIETLKTITGMFPFYSELAGGCGKGYDDLLFAEYAMERGEFEKAQLFALRSFYKASSLEQYDVIICAQFCLARLKLAEGEISEAVSIMNLLGQKIASFESPILQASFDVSSAYIGCQIKEMGQIQKWVQNLEIENCPILYHGKGLVYIVCAKYLLMQKEYIRLEVLCEQMVESFARFNNQLGYVHTYILDAIAKYHLYNIAVSEIPMLQALEIGFADQLVFPFAEYGTDIMDLLMEIKKRDTRKDPAFASYLDSVIAQVIEYFTSLKDSIDDTEILSTLSSRELEVLRLVAQGKTNQSIASSLFVAEVTVRKHLTSLYKKLNVGGRAEAVRRAMELGVS